MAPVGTKPINPVEEDGFARKVLDASLNGIYIYDLNLGQNIFINKQYTTLTGYTLDELNAMGREQFMALFHPDERQRVIEHMQNMACLDKGVLEVDYRFRTKDGRWIWCLSRDSVFSCTADGSVIQFIGTFIDITEHKQAHQELEHKRRLLSEAEKLSHTGAWEWDPDTGQWSFSEGWLSLHGCPMRTLKQEDLIALAHPQDRDRIVRAFGKVCKGEALYDLEHRIVRMDNGEVRLIHGLGRYVRDDAGKVVKVFGLSKDITDQRESEQALYQQRELMQHIFDVVPVLLVIWDPQMNRFTLNRYAETVFGWTTAEANQGDFMGMVYPDAAYRAEVETYMQSLQPGWREWLIATKSGESIPIDWANILLADDTRIGIGVDLRERKKAEAMLSRSKDELEHAVKSRTIEIEIQNRQLEQMNQVIKEMARQNIRAMENDRKALSKEIHDSIGGSLSAIKMLLETRLNEFGQPPPAGIVSFEDIIGHLSDTIKESKRISYQMRSLALDDFGLVAAVSELVKKFKEFYPWIRVRDHIEITEDDFSDEIKTVVYRVLQEALNNVGKHSRAERAEIVLQELKDRLVLEVKDNGCGFDVDGTLDSDQSIHGFGMHSMRERVEICKGALDVSSSPGRGTCISAFIPKEII